MYENNVKLIGFVGQVDVYQSEGKKPFAKVTLATNKSYKNELGELVAAKPVWHNLRFFGNLVTVVRDLVSKGSQIYVSGELAQEAWTTDENRKQTVSVINVQKIIVFERSPKLGSGPTLMNANTQEVQVPC